MIPPYNYCHRFVTSVWFDFLTEEVQISFSINYRLLRFFENEYPFTMHPFLSGNTDEMSNNL